MNLRIEVQVHRLLMGGNASGRMGGKTNSNYLNVKNVDSDKTCISELGIRTP